MMIETYILSVAFNLFNESEATAIVSTKCISYILLTPILTIINTAVPNILRRIVIWIFSII